MKPHVLIPELQPCVFGGPSLNRLNNFRHYPETSAKLCHPKAKYVVLSSELKVLIRSSGCTTFLALLSATACSQFPTGLEGPLLLGVDADDTPYIALQILQSADETQAPIPSDTRFVHLRAVLSDISSAHASIAAHARSLFAFHERHKFCGRCGAMTVSDRAGARRRCVRNVLDVEPSEIKLSDDKQCDGVWFPRTDPVVIMLVVAPCGERILLGRQKRYPPGLYSCLAGFMEHGEGVEDAVRREVFEESSVRVGRVRFFASQPWPFPYSLMLGCVAQADSEEILIDADELEHAKWFSREEVEKMMARNVSDARSPKVGETDDELYAPPTAAIAGRLLEIFTLQEPITLFATRETQTCDTQLRLGAL
ncbi:unnamed protein product [Agarophyton chilense]|eukprot:gb/GEZJ01004874.1/.p1 GENE.gb/GEZJ01004874.1/~~gb/GEZJ01004874.1/.p1  ORF type:complete len:367 (-),score=42.26 gb/GEZJ01004874.1/:663-1763(-)